MREALSMTKQLFVFLLWVILVRVDQYMGRFPPPPPPWHYCHASVVCGLAGGVCGSAGSGLWLCVTVRPRGVRLQEECMVLQEVGSGSELPFGHEAFGQFLAHDLFEC